MACRRKIGLTSTDVARRVLLEYHLWNELNMGDVVTGVRVELSFLVVGRAAEGDESYCCYLLSLPGGGGLDGDAPGARVASSSPAHLSCAAVCYGLLCHVCCCYRCLVATLRDVRRYRIRWTGLPAKHGSLAGEPCGLRRGRNSR